MADEELISLETKAREWLEMAQQKWRLQTMQHRSRYNPKTGEYKQLPTRVRRFLNGTPVSMKALVLSILKESAPYSCPVFDLETGDAKYVPTNTFIRKDGPELTSGGADATYTIIQDLKLFDEAGDVFGVRDQSSCAQVGESEWHWDEPDVMECPDGSQGVSYQIANVNRDRETDLFSYEVRKVQALTVHTEPVTVACTERARVTVETWDNVYGEPGAFRWDPVAGGSAALAIPEACDSRAGTLRKVSVNRNADCTYRVEVETTRAVSGTGMYFVQHDQYKTESGERTLNAFVPLSKTGVEYNNGLIVRYQSEKNEDGTWNNDVQNTQEREVRSSVVENRITPRGSIVTRTDTNVDQPASGISSDFGMWKYTKTPGGLYTNEYVEYSRRLVDNLGLVCTDTAFMKTHETQGSANAVPPASSHVPPAFGGRVTTWMYDTDSEGLVSKRIRTEQEHTVENAVRRVSWGWLGNTSGFTHKSVTASVAQELLASGTYGSQAEARMTNGGLFDVDVSTFTCIAGRQLGFDCQKTVYQHSHETSESAADIGTDAQNAGGGKTYRRSYSRDTTTGAVTKHEAVMEELLVPESRRSVRVSSRARVVRTTTSNSPTKPADASKIGTSTEVEVTPGGRYNVTTETAIPNKGTFAEECSKDAFLHTHVTVKGAEANTLSGNDVPEAGEGEYHERQLTLNELGVWEERKTDHTEIREDSRTVNYQDAFGTRTVQLFANGDDRFGDKVFDPEDLIKSVEQELTRGKKYSARVTEEKPNEVDSGWLHYGQTTSKGLAVYYDFIVFRNAKISKVKQWIAHIADIKYSGGTGSYANHPSINISPNRFKLWDGSISLTVTYTPKEWASGGTTPDDNWEQDNIKIKSVNFIPVSQTKLLKIVTEETHKRGGGVGQKRAKTILSGSMIKGSQFSYHPSGQSFAYDIITSVVTKAKVIDLPTNTATIWDGSNNP